MVQVFGRAEKRGKQEVKIFFSEEKKQKTFANEGLVPPEGSATAHGKSFGSFLQKRTSSFLPFPSAAIHAKLLRNSNTLGARK